MRFGQIFILAGLMALLVGCASPGPRDPAPIDYRTSSQSGPPPRIISPNPRCEDGATYTVREGDTLSEIAEACGIPTRELAEANGLYPPYEILAGQEISMPRPAVHIVRPGENLYRIGLRYNISYETLAAHNGILAPYEIEVGQEIRLPSGSVRTAQLDAPSPPADRPTRRQPTIDTPVTVEQVDPPPPTPRRTSTPPDPEPTGPVSFQWPIRGDIVSGFGPKPDGQRNDGINIAANEGDSVRASEAGTVVYAGGELQGFGELILIRHAGGWVTAYAHNSRLLVNEGDRVTQGQLIAEAGQTGSVDSPQVHFEIRQGVNPEDPMRHLPAQ